MTSKKQPARKRSDTKLSKATKAISPKLGRWATLWWGLSCGYFLLVTILVFFPLDYELNVIVLGVTLILIYIGWVALYAWWRMDLAKAKVALRDGWHELFTMRF